MFLINTNTFAQNFWQKLSLYGGGVSSIAINQSNELFAGSEVTGISKSSDNGDNWQQVNGELEFPRVGKIAVTSNGYIFAEIGSLFQDGENDSVSIYLSNDGGSSWTKVYDCQVNEDITDIVVTPNGEVFVSIFNDVNYTSRMIKSSDNGATWADVSFPNLYGSIECLAVNSSGNIFAGAEDGIYRSVDYGITWVNITGIYYLYSVQAIDIAGQGYIFAGLGSGQIYRSIDNGETWMAVYQGSYDSEYEAISINSNNVIFAGLTYTISENDSSYMLSSSDGGQTWSLAYTYSNTNITSIEADTSGSVFVGTIHNVYRSTDNGATWSETTNGLTNYIAQNFATNSLGYTYVGSYGLPLVYTADLGENWTKFDNLGHIWAQGLAINASDHIFVGTENGMFKSVDNGVNWTTVFPDTTYFMSISIKSDGTIFASANEDGVFRSSDNGASWTSVNNGFINNEGIRPIIFDSNGYIYAGSDSGSVYHSTNNGDTWVSVSNGLPNEEIHALTTNPEGHLFAGTISDVSSTSFTGGVYRSIDGGVNWMSVNTGLTGSGVTALIINSLGDIYAGTLEDGVFKSTDNGENWSAVNSGFTSIGVWPMGIDNDGYLYTGNFDGLYRTTQSTTASYTVDVKPDSTPTTGKDLNITVTPSENFQPTSQILYYRYSGESSWRQIAIETGSDTLNFTIPSDSVTYRGIEYYIQLSDGQTTVTYPPNDPQTNPASLQVKVDRQVTPLNLKPMTYKMVSIPIMLNNSEIDSVLADDYHHYDIKNWRVLRYQTHYDSAGYFEHAQIDTVYNRYGIDSTFTPGNAFWLITRSGEQFDVENGLSVNTAESFYQTLQPGWNQVGNPFPFPVAVDTIDNVDLIEPPVYYDGSEYLYEQTVLYPWEGYFVYNTSAAPVTISIPPVEATTNPLPKEKSKLQTISEDGYALQLSAKMKNTKLVDTQNFLGFSSQTADEKDQFDLSEAPPIGDYLRVSILNEKERFTSNFKSASENGQHWDMEISLSEYIKKPIEITLFEFGKLPENFKIFILDKDYISAIPVKNNKFTIEIYPNFPVRHLKFIIGTETFAQQNNEEIPLVPVQYRLKQNYPNPFNSGTIIQYQLGKRTPVEMSIFDILGRKVRTLINEKQTTGSHSIHWNGLNDSEIQVASGVYFYRLEAGNFIDSKKLLIVR